MRSVYFLAVPGILLVLCPILRRSQSLELSCEEAFARYHDVQDGKTTRGDLEALFGKPGGITRYGALDSMIWRFAEESLFNRESVVITAFIHRDATVLESGLSLEGSTGFKLWEERWQRLKQQAAGLDRNANTLALEVPPTKLLRYKAR